MNSLNPSALGDGRSERATTLDAGALARLRELDPDGRGGVVQRVLRTYQQSMHTHLPLIAAASASGDLGELARVAHMLKSSSAAIGALEFSTLCARLEHAVRQGWTAADADSVPHLLAEGQRVQLAVAQHLGT